MAKKIKCYILHAVSSSDTLTSPDITDWVRMDLLRSSGPTTLIKQDQLQLAVQDNNILLGVDYTHKLRQHSFSGKPACTGAWDYSP